MRYAILLIAGTCLGIAACSFAAKPSGDTAMERPASSVASCSDREGTVPALLPPCPSSPKCVSSIAGCAPEGRTVPAFVGDVPGVIPEALTDAVLQLPGCTIETRTPARVHALCRSRVFGFIDDLDLAAEQDSTLVHVRSSARLGWWDFGVNRARVERLHALYGQRVQR
ncbi:DUF1499 domain-containing protein [Nitratidesulfovibrio vulgaris]|uniref:Lipoprotein, putative n=2 Tax=Nitratidesulfovibrio vulgaris TaxID=881 RepID=Q728M0_NITV2|nr:DUF1499 domain-containing protein [Nitratidesulfovibrio vulgaris]AAS97055.1 lipoprotein, putative [Nitratidesulfovibrio vulgaris str. Hildenborough]ABM27687.1 protein of unknown function DUF1499 [Nitratidesulfovibrio vulgaris DP4]ADP87529.1 hypothetical protein Deval_2385 [Nitratidesulfovibrio vulgaris RCH1]GEB81515.1 lipoprotein [Desulfovibrio desulfuricans]